MTPKRYRPTLTDEEFEDLLNAIQFRADDIGSRHIMLDGEIPGESERLRIRLHHLARRLTLFKANTKGR